MRVIIVYKCMYNDIRSFSVSFSVGSDCCELQNRRRVPAQCQEVIKVPKNDPIYLDRGQTCINFNRAETSFTYGCPLEPTTFVSTLSIYNLHSRIQIEIQIYKPYKRKLIQKLGEFKTGKKTIYYNLTDCFFG